MSKFNRIKNFKSAEQISRKLRVKKNLFRINCLNICKNITENYKKSEIVRQVILKTFILSLIKYHPIVFFLNASGIAYQESEPDLIKIDDSNFAHKYILDRIRPRVQIMLRRQGYRYLTVKLVYTTVQRCCFTYILYVKMATIFIRRERDACLNIYQTFNRLTNYSRVSVTNLLLNI